MIFNILWKKKIDSESSQSLTAQVLCKQRKPRQHEQTTFENIECARPSLFHHKTICAMSDSDSSPKKAGVPSWQLKPKDTTTGPEEPAPESSRETVLAQAKKFLEEDEIKNASTDKKISFLESKGLKSEDIHDLPGITRNEETAPAVKLLRPTPIHANTNQSQTPSPTESSPHTQNHSTPPIITYPEFLTTSPAPAPLITRRRLLTTLYLFSGLSALLYGTHNYLITPMLSSLTTSRLSLSETARENLQRLVEKLEESVSEIPSNLHVKGSGDGYREEEESDEDPTEMFHRDIGTQTSLQSQPASPALQATPSMLDDQTSRLQDLKFTLSDLVDNGVGEDHEVSDLSATLGELRDYLDGMAYVTPNYGFGSVGGYSGIGTRAEREKDDEISKVKAGIISVKGVLLSARSFPGGGSSVGRVR